jgi:cytochrome P450
VRLGPNDISLTDPAAVAVISSTNTKCSKAPWYANDTPLTSMHTTRDRQQHDRRRKVWSPAFSPAALRGYEGRVQRYNEQLIEGLASRKFVEKDGSNAVNVSEVFNWYSFDVMGDLAFGRSFDCLTSGETHWAINLLNEGMKPAGLGMPTWFFQFIISIPGAATDYWRFIDFCSAQLAKRMGEQEGRNRKLKETGKEAPTSVSDDRDITHTLIEHFNGMGREDQRKALPMLQGDSRLIIVAGSDTTAATLVYVFCWLARYPELQKRLREEMDKCRVGAGEEKDAASGSPFSHQKLLDAELLNGVIYEALRLNPPVPSGIFRKTPKEGVYIGKTFIPGDTTIQMPWYVMARGLFSPK